MQRQQQARRSLRQFETLELETLEQRCLLTSAIVINEIHYDPPDKTEFSEFIELYNRTDASIDLSGWEFKDGVRYEFPSGTNLGPNDYLVVAQDPATVLNVFVQARLVRGMAVFATAVKGFVSSTLPTRRSMKWTTSGAFRGPRSAKNRVIRSS